MSKESQAEKSERKAYEAPRIIRVSLRPEEAVLGHCKIASSTGPAGSCAFFCKAPGS